MKKIFILITLAVLLIISSVSYAGIYGNDDPAILASMYNNPGRYVHIGNDNFGLSFYLDKTTVNVHEYAPPNYIIAFKSVYHLNAINPDKHVTTEHAGYTRVGIQRYKYEYTARKMYVEKYDSNGTAYWEYLTPLSQEQQRKMTGGAIRGHEREIAQGEIAFFLAYGMSFYQKPLTNASESFINKNISSMIPLLKSNLPDLQSNKDKQLRYEYNHKTNQIEVWQYTYNPNKRDFDSKRIK